MILGLHLDVRRGHLQVLRDAETLRCGALQMFSHRRHREPDPRELADFRAARAAGPVSRLAVHARYLPFLASGEAAWRRRSVELLAREQRLAGDLGADFLIVHLGAYSPGAERRKGLRLFADGVRAALDGAPRGPRLLLENVPGGGRRMGGSLEDLAEMLGLLGARGTEAGACLDTAHAWAQGYDLASAEAALRFLARVHRRLGAERVAAFHLNDTQAVLGSHREHHWHLGQGHLGTEGLRVLLSRPEYAGALGILETPRTPGMDEANLALARSLAGS